jgi:hypothetical protein
MKFKVWITYESFIYLKNIEYFFPQPSAYIDSICIRFVENFIEALYYF